MQPWHCIHRKVVIAIMRVWLCILLDNYYKRNKDSLIIIIIIIMTSELKNSLGMDLHAHVHKWNNQLLKIKHA